jgi:hypothetical protein
MDRKRLFRIAMRIANGEVSIFDAVNADLSEAKNVDHARSILGQHKIKLFKEPPYPDDIPTTPSEVGTGIESVDGAPVVGMNFLRKLEHGWGIEGPPK